MKAVTFQGGKRKGGNPTAGAWKKSPKRLIFHDENSWLILQLAKRLSHTGWREFGRVMSVPSRLFFKTLPMLSKLNFEFKLLSSRMAILLIMPCFHPRQVFLVVPPFLVL